MGLKNYNRSFSEANKAAFLSVSDIISPGDDLLQTTLTELIPGTTYTINVAAVNNAGVGERSNTILATTLPGLHMYSCQ